MQTEESSHQVADPDILSNTEVEPMECVASDPDAGDAMGGSVTTCECSLCVSWSETSSFLCMRDIEDLIDTRLRYLRGEVSETGHIAPLCDFARFLGDMIWMIHNSEFDLSTYLKRKMGELAIYMALTVKANRDMYGPFRDSDRFKAQGVGDQLVLLIIQIVADMVPAIRPRLFSL